MIRASIIVFLYASYIVLCKSVLHRHGVDIFFNTDLKLLAADAFLSRKLYIFVIQENGRFLLKTANFSKLNRRKMRDVLKFPVQSAESVAVDWVNGNLYWADQKNQFIEVVDLNVDSDFPISRDRRRILLSRNMADIHSLVVDPWEQYLFWLQIGAIMVLERSRLDGSDRRVIHKSILFKSSQLAIDRHRKMLFWWGLDGEIHRVDYQGQTGCSMRLQGSWKQWSPTFLTFTEGKLVFINDDQLWVSSFECGTGISVQLNTNPNIAPIALVSRKHQLTVPRGKRRSPCMNRVCSSICLPIVDSAFRCACSTGITEPSTNSICPAFPTRSLFIGNPPKIYHMSLDNQLQPLELLSENAGIPFRFAYDSVTSSLLYVDFNSSSIFSLDLNKYGTPQKLYLDFPISSDIPVSIAVDSTSRNIYWMNHRNSEVWVARISSFNRLKYATLLLSWQANPTFKESYYQQNQPPGELAVDSINRYLFVTVIRDGTCSIERYWLDGTQKFTVISSTIDFWPRGLALDMYRHQLYFVDTVKGDMISVDYQGGNKRILAQKFQEFISLSYFDDFIYWTELETLSIHSVKYDGSMRSLVVKTRNLDARTMPVIAVSRNASIDTSSPCFTTSNKCDQLCFPVRINKYSFSCGCSNPAHVLLNLSRCSYSSEMIVYFNTSMLITHHLSPNIDKQFIELGKGESDVQVASLQLDHYRNQIYWINQAANCIMKTASNTDIQQQLKIFCLSSDTISNIAVDFVRNNLYASVTSSVWSRIMIIRLPFTYSDVSWTNVVVSTKIKNKILGAVSVHSDLKFLFWFETKTKDRLNTAELFQAYLDGSQPALIWRGVADIDELVVDEQANYVCWKSSDSRKVYRYDIINRKWSEFQLSLDILRTVNSGSSEWLHVYPNSHSLYLFMVDSIYQVTLSDSSPLITRKQLTFISNVGHTASIRGFSFVSRSLAVSMKKIALAKSDIVTESVVLCPTHNNDNFITCSQFCLPVESRECGCGSVYSLSANGSTCIDSSDLLMVMTNTGEIIGVRGNILNDKDDEIDFVEWVELSEQPQNYKQKFIDAVYWLSKNIVLRLDNNGFISAIDRSRPYVMIKKYKQLSVQEDNIKTYSGNYENLYKHFLSEDFSFKNQYAKSRYSLAIDPISDTLLWSDWVTGIIAAERLNADKDRIEFLGVIINFRESRRRPLQIAIAPISSSLIWLSADMSSSETNDSSIWRQFWIEMSDLDGNRRSVLVKNPGIPSCLTVDVHSGRIYWIDTKTNKLMYLHIHWDNYQIRAGHVMGHNMRVTTDSLLSNGVGLSTSSMVVLKKYLFWTDWFQQIFASISVNSDNIKPTAELGMHFYNLQYLKDKLKTVVRIMARIAPEDFKISSLGTLLQNHPCSHTSHEQENKRCSHFCLSTLPISLAEEYSFLMTAQQLDGKFRCSCPMSMSVTHKARHKIGFCVESQLVKCDRYQIPCKAGLVFSKKEGMSVMSCMSVHQRCDSTVDCLDGSDEVGCNTCNSSHFYSCSGSGMCLPITKRCDEVMDCDSDEQCCGSQKFECLSGKDASRCLTVAARCNGIIDCRDGSDEHNCNRNSRNRALSTLDPSSVVNLSNNYTVAIIAGSVALSACSFAIIYICLSRRIRQKTVHESCLFRANNVNIMFMSSTANRRSRPFRSSSTYDRHNPSPTLNLYHAKSCDIIDNVNGYDTNDLATQSLTSLSECYRQIKNPQPCPNASVLGRPLFSMQDDILFQLSRFKPLVNHCASNSSIKKFEKLPPSEVTMTSDRGDKPDDPIDKNNEIASRNSLLSSPCESELEEIYVHRYQLSRHPSQFDNYPSCLLQNLLSACNQTSQPCNTPTTVYKDLVVENVYRRKRRKIFKSRKPRSFSKGKLSLSSSRRARSDRSQYTSNFYNNSSSNLDISPPPPSPITMELA